MSPLPLDSDGDPALLHDREELERSELTAGIYTILSARAKSFSAAVGLARLPDAQLVKGYPSLAGAIRYIRGSALIGKLRVFGHNEALHRAVADTDSQIIFLNDRGQPEKIFDHTARLLGTSLIKIGRVALITGLLCTRKASSSRPQCSGPEAPGPVGDNFAGSVSGVRGSEQCTQIQICNDMVPLLDTFAAAATTTAAELDYLLSAYYVAKDDKDRVHIYMKILACLVYWEAMVEELKKVEEFNRTILLILATSPTGYQSGKAVAVPTHRLVAVPTLPRLAVPTPWPRWYGGN